MRSRTMKIFLLNRRYICIRIRLRATSWLSYLLCIMLLSCLCVHHNLMLLLWSSVSRRKNNRLGIAWNINSDTIYNNCLLTWRYILKR